MQLVQCYLRAAELEMQAAQESLRSDLAMAGLRAQVLGRTEVLEARERERREVVLVVAPLPHVLGGRAMPWWAKASRRERRCERDGFSRVVS